MAGTALSVVMASFGNCTTGEEDERNDVVMGNSKAKETSKTVRYDIYEEWITRKTWLIPVSSMRTDADHLLDMLRGGNRRTYIEFPT